MQPHSLKKYFFTLFVSLFAITSFGQKFSLEELISLEKNSIDEFDTYVTAKGYIYLRRGMEAGADVITYSYRQSDSTARKFIQKFTTPKENSNRMITFKTNNTEDYLSIKADLKKLGFKFKSSSDLDGDSGFTYNNGKSFEDLIIVIIIIRQKKWRNGEDGSIYEISVQL